MKKFFLLAFVLLASSLVFADIGPSPSFSFSIGNADSFPEYDFYYASYLMSSDKLYPVYEDTGVYKLGTDIKIHALPAGAAPVVSDSVAVSEEISLSAGSTVFKVESIDPEAGTMSLSLASSTPEAASGPDFGLMVVGFVAVVAVVIVLALVLRKPKKAVQAK